MMPDSESDNVADVVDRLTREGYVHDFRPVPGGLRSERCSSVHAPEGFEVHRVFRFEGPSNPDDESIVFALSCREDGLKGTFVAAYGPSMSEADADVVQKLTPHRR